MLVCLMRGLEGVPRHARCSSPRAGIDPSSVVVGLALHAMHWSKPSRLKLTASLLKVLSFSIEVESQDERQGRELGTGTDDLKTSLLADATSHTRAIVNR